MEKVSTENECYYASKDTAILNSRLAEYNTIQGLTGTHNKAVANRATSWSLCPKDVFNLNNVGRGKVNIYKSNATEQDPLAMPQYIIEWSVEVIRCSRSSSQV